MTAQTSKLKIGLLDNGSHSLERGYEMWAQWKKSGDAWLLKESVIWIHHGIELLLKQLVVQSNEFLVFQDVNKAVERLGILRKKTGMENAGVLDLFDHDDKVMSVGFKNLIDRVAITMNISELSEKEPLREKIDVLTRTRNKIVHFSVDLDVVEISGLLSEILSPLLSLLSKEVQDQKFKEKTIPKIRKVAQPLREYIEYMRKEIVDSAIKSTQEALLPTGSRRAGIVSQALGSGLTKSLLSYLKLAKGICDKTIIVIVDRQILAHQLYEVLSNDNELNPAFPDSKVDLSSLISSYTHDIIICTVQKFISYDVAFSRGYLIVGFDISSIPESFESTFPNATYILFTHTPGRLASSFFGRVVGSYDLSQAITDKVSIPFKIEKIECGLEKNSRTDNSGSEFNNIDFTKALINSEYLLNFFAEKIIFHLESNEDEHLRKAYVVVRDTNTADILLSKILELKPEWQKRIEADEVVSVISSKIETRRREILLKNFSKKNSPLSLLIGTKNILVGYDNPSLNTVYLTCPVPRHIQYKLMSAVTRHEKNKLYGLVVDFCGLDWPLDGFAKK